MLMKWKSLFAAALTAAVALPALAQDATGGGIPSGRVISVSVIGGNYSNNTWTALPSIKGTEGQSGLAAYRVDNANWNELTQQNSGNTGGTPETLEAPVDNTGAPTFATVTARLGGWWHLQEPEASEPARMNAVGYMGVGFCDPSKVADTNELTLANVPYTEYSLILYYGTNHTGNKWAAPKVTFADGTFKTYTYAADAAGAATEGTDAWGSTTAATTSGQAGTLGKDVMLIEGLSGNISIDLGTQPNDGAAAQAGSLCGFQIVEVLPSISVNFAGDESGTYSEPIPKTSEAYGLFPVPGSEWKNGFTGSGTIQVSSAYGSSETFSSTLSYKSKNIWHNTDSYNTLLQTYLDDGTKPDEKITGASISMDNVPFTEYAVIVYCAGGDSAFLPVTVNGKTYTYQDNATVEGSANFGSSSVTTPTLGQNALCVTGLTDAALTVQGQSGGENTARGGIAAIQIICTGEVDASLAPAPEAETSVISLNFGSNYGSVPQTADNTYGLIPVPGYTWTNISGASGSQPVTVASGKPLTKEPTVDYDSDLTYCYNPATDPFLKGYLGDGQRSEGVGASVTVSNLPFWAYDVVVYAGLGDNGAVARPVQINGTLYTWNNDRGATIATDDATAAYGGIQPTAQYGRNALRVKGLSDYEYKLTIQGLPRSGSQRGGIAAIQIVERKVIQNNNISDLDPDSDTPVHILLTKQISGDLTLPPDAILDLSTYWLYGATPPITGTLTVNEGTQIRLPKGASWTIAGTIEGADSLADNAVIVGGSLATGVKVSGGTISADATYVWTGDFDNLWSNQYNWSSHTVPNGEADVTIPLDANGAVTIELPSDTGAVAKSVTITGPESGAATLALTSAEGETGSLTVSGRMLATGNVIVTQSADITVNGEAKVEVINEEYNVSGSTQAGFHVHQGTWKILSGTLSMPTEGETNIGEAGISGSGTLIVGGEGASEATLAVRRIRTVYYNKDTGLASGTLRVATGGTLTASSSVQLSTQNYTTELAGGTIETPTLITFAGATVSADSSLRAPTGRTATVRTQSRTNDALTGTGGVTLSGTVTIASELAGYTGTLTVSEGAKLTLSDNARPNLVLKDNASLTVTPTPNEMANTSIVFQTSMTTEPTNVTYTVSGVTKTITVTVNDNEDTLTLSWGADYPTLSTTSNWSTTESWANLPNGTTYPTSGSAILDGTQAAIKVKLDTDLSDMTSIFVKGNVTLVTKEAQPAIPACVKLTTGATLTVDANFSGAWELPAGTTLQVTEDFTSFANLTLEGAVVILEGASGTLGEPNTIEAPSPVEFNGGLRIKASNLTLKSMYNVGKTLELAGDNITIAGNRFFTDTGTQVVNTGTDNAITGMTGLNGSLAVEGGTLALTLGASPTNTFSGATIAGGATLTLAAVPDSSTGVTTAQGWFFPVTGDGTLEIEVGYDFRPMFSAVSQEATTLPKNMVFTATKAEQAAGLISCLNNNNSATLPEGLTVTVYPAEDGGAWVPNAVLEAGGNPYLRIYNVPAPNGLTGLDDAVALTLRQAAAKEGITNGNYTVQLRTKGGQTTIASPDAATLNDVLGCFIGLKATANAEGTTLTYAYDFGIVGIKRNTTGDGWVVTAQVRQEGNDNAGFAAGNTYTLTVNGAPAADASATVGENGTVTFTVPDASVAGETCTLGVKVARPAAQP